MGPIKETCCAVLTVFSLLLTGCSGSGVGAEARQPTYQVTGKVTLNGAPVPNAMVSFSPKGKQPVATGRSGADGTYTVTTYDAGDGAVAGDYVVLVTKSAAAPTASAGGHDPNNIPDGEAMHAAQSGAGGASNGAGSLLPEKYSRPDQSDLFAKVEAKSENVINFELKP